VARGPLLFVFFSYRMTVLGIQNKNRRHKTMVWDKKKNHKYYVLCTLRQSRALLLFCVNTAAICWKPCSPNDNNIKNCGFENHRQ